MALASVAVNVLAAPVRGKLETILIVPVNRSPAGGAPLGAQLATTATSTVMATRHMLVVDRIMNSAQAYYLSRYQVSLDCVHNGGAGETAISSRYHLSTGCLEITGQRPPRPPGTTCRQPVSRSVER